MWFQIQLSSNPKDRRVFAFLRRFWWLERPRKTKQRLEEMKKRNASHSFALFVVGFRRSRRRRGRMRLKFIFFLLTWHEKSSLLVSSLIKLQKKTQRVSQKCELKPLTKSALWRRPLTMIVSSNRYSRYKNDYLRTAAIWDKLVESERRWWYPYLTLNFTATTTARRKSWYSFFESVFFKQEEERASREQ